MKTVLPAIFIGLICFARAFASGDERGNGGHALALEFKALASEALREMAAQSSQDLKTFDVHKMSKILDGVSIYVVESPLYMNRWFLISIMFIICNGKVALAEESNNLKCQIWYSKGPLLVVYSTEINSKKDRILKTKVSYQVTSAQGERVTQESSVDQIDADRYLFKNESGTLRVDAPYFINGSTQILTWIVWIDTLVASGTQSFVAEKSLQVVDGNTEGIRLNLSKGCIAK